MPEDLLEPGLGQSHVAQPTIDASVNTPTHKESHHFFICLLILLFGAVAGFSLHDKIIKPKVPDNTNIIVTPTMTMGVPSIPQTTAKESERALITHLPNFDSLTVNDLPNMRDTRGVYPYKGRYVVAGIDKLVVYDSTLEMVVQTNNPAVLQCVFSTALIGDNLYITCNKATLMTNGTSSDKSTLLRLNLTSGKITKQYFMDDTKPRINFWVTSLGTDLWGSSWDGVFRMDTNTEKIVEYSSQAIGYPNCRPSRIYIKDNTVRVAITNGSDCPGGIAAYDAHTNTWSRLPDSNEAIDTVNQAPKVEGKTLPFYVAVSPRIDDFYYLFTYDSAYTVSRMGLPQIFKKLNHTIDTASYTAVYVSPDKKYALLVGTPNGMTNNTLAEILPIYLIRLQTGEVYNLTSSYTQDLGQNSTIGQTIAQGVTLTAQPHGVLIIGGNDRKLVGTVDFLSHTFIFSDTKP